MIFGGGGRVTAFGGAFVVDTFARVMKVLILFGSAAAITLSVHFMKQEKIEKFEYPILVLLATVGMMMMVSANDLISLYMGLELQSLALYVVAAIDRDNARSSEAGLKYFVLGALSSGMLLYGASLIYGFTGATGFPEIAAAIKAGAGGLGVVFGIVFVIAGLAFKVSAVPFHMWTPDVYEGSPTPVTAFFSAAPKVAAMALLVRTMFAPFSGIDPRLAADPGLRLDCLDGVSAPSRRSARPISSDCLPIPRSAIWALHLSASLPAARRACAASSST